MTDEARIRLDRDKRQVQAWLGDEQVGGITVVHVDFDWGRRTVVPMAGIGGVGTKDGHRGHGIAGRMVEKAVAFSREEGYPVGGVSTGRGNVARRLYARGGYVHLFSVDRYEKPVARVEPAPAPDGVAVRPYVPGDEKGIMELWRRRYAMGDVFGGTRADPARWAARRAELLEADPRSVWVAVRDGAVVGWGEYFIHWGGRESCEILVDESPDAADVARGLLTRLEASLHDAGLTRLVCHATHHQARTTSSLVEAGCRRTEGYVFMVAVFDLAGLLDRLRPLYEGRLRDGQLGSWPGALRVEMAGQAAEVELPGGGAGERIALAGPYETLVRVLCGRSSAWEEYLRGRLGIEGARDRDGVRALDAVLGRRPWFHPLRDRW